jgi:hypothetical protein
VTHQHSSGCYDDAGPGHGASLVCGQLAGIDPEPLPPDLEPDDPNDFPAPRLRLRGITPRTATVTNFEKLELAQTPTAELLDRFISARDAEAAADRARQQAYEAHTRAVNARTDVERLLFSRLMGPVKLTCSDAAVRHRGRVYWAQQGAVHSLADLAPEDVPADGSPDDDRQF